jgi:hypothetical protein
MTVASSSTGSGRLTRTTPAVLLGLGAGLLLRVSLVFAYQGFYATRPSPRRALWSTARCSLRLKGEPQGVVFTLNRYYPKVLLLGDIRG